MPECQYCEDGKSSPSRSSTDFDGLDYFDYKTKEEIFAQIRLMSTFALKSN